MFSRSANERFDSVVEDLYAGALDITAWNRGISGIIDLVGASGALLLAFNPSTGAVLRGEDYRLDPNVLRDYQRYWSYEDIRLQHALTAAVGCPVTEATLAIPAWKRARVLNEFLLPSDLPHFMPLWLLKSKTKAATLSLQGTRKRGPFDTDDMNLYRRFAPHLARALEIRDRLEQARIDASTISTVLERAHFGVLVLDWSGKLLEANRFAQTIITANAHGIRRRPDGTLWLREPAGSLLTKGISTGVPLKFGVDGLLHVPRENKQPLSLLVVALGKESASWMVPAPHWLVLIFDPEYHQAVDAQFLAQDLQISPREAEVAASLMTGESLPAIARRFGVSHNTVRSQLKSVYKKIGVGSQSELVRRLAFGPAVWNKKSYKPMR